LVERQLDAGVFVEREGRDVVDRLDDVPADGKLPKLLREIGAVPPDDRRHASTIAATVSGRQRGKCLVIRTVDEPTAGPALAEAAVDAAVAELEVVIVAHADDVVP